MKKAGLPLKRKVSAHKLLLCSNWRCMIIYQYLMKQLKWDPIIYFQCLLCDKLASHFTPSTSFATHQASWVHRQRLSNFLPLLTSALSSSITLLFYIVPIDIYCSYTGLHTQHNSLSHIYTNTHISIYIFLFQLISLRLDLNGRESPGFWLVVSMINYLRDPFVFHSWSSMNCWRVNCRQWWCGVGWEARWRCTPKNGDVLIAIHDTKQRQQPERKKRTKKKKNTWWNLIGLHWWCLFERQRIMLCYIGRRIVRYDVGDIHFHCKIKCHFIVFKCVCVCMLVVGGAQSPFDWFECRFVRSGIELWWQKDDGFWNNHVL